MKVTFVEIREVDLHMDPEKMKAACVSDKNLNWADLYERLIEGTHTETDVIWPFACSTWPGSVLDLLSAQLDQDPRGIAIQILADHFGMVLKDVKIPGVEVK